MFLKIIGRNLFYPVAIFLVIILWLFITEPGCKASFWLIKNIIPGELKIENVQGTWINRLMLNNFEYENSTLKFSAEKATFDPMLRSLLNSTIQLSYVGLKNASLVWKENATFPLLIEDATGQFQMTFNRQSFAIDVQHIIGTWHKMPLDGHVKINVTDKCLQIPMGTLALGENKISIGKSGQTKNQFEWGINLNIPKVKAYFNGTLIPEQKENHWAGQLNKADFSSETIGTWILKIPSTFKISDTAIALGDITLKNNTKRLQINANLYYGKQGLNSNFKLTSLFIPKQALTLKNLHLNISGRLDSPLRLKGSGYSGEGKFQVDGTMQLNAEKKLLLNLQGKNLLLYNTQNIQIIGSPTLTLKLSHNALFVDGTLLIPRAYIAIEDQKNVTLLSKDIVLTDAVKFTAKNEEFKIIPNLYVVIENNLHFDGYGIIGTVGGKLTINERSDGLLTGNGKLTIKEGKYRLQGATRYIHHGRLLFPPGTLLKDPLLDILISQNRVQQQASITSTNVGLYVQGTLQHPVYHPYSNDSNLKNADILSRLGFGQNEASSDENQRQLFSQTAFLFSGTANPFIDLLQKNLNLEEFNLESKQMNKNSDTQAGPDTVLMIGKSLSEKLYLQYLQSIIEPISMIRLKYFLSRYFTVSAETGTEGIGGDLTFVMEKN